MGLIAFASPWLLGALAALPLVWWLVRLTPPAPRRAAFPALMLLQGLVAREETPARTPPWLLLLRLLLAALVIVALAEPVLNPGGRLPGQGPLLLLVDDGWAAAPGWAARRQALDQLLSQAERQQRPLLLLTTAPVPGAHPGGQPAPLRGPLAPAEARRLLQGLEPRPWATDRAGALAAARAALDQPGSGAVWLSDGLDDGLSVAGSAPGPTAALIEELRHRGSLTVLRPPAAALPHLLLAPTLGPGGLTLHALRAASGAPESLPARVSAGDGRLLGRVTLTFAADARRAEARLALPLELRNQALRLSLESEVGAGATVLLDRRWRRPLVGLVAPAEAQAGAGTEQPLLDDLFYLERALAPSAELSRGPLATLLVREPALLLLADAAPLAAEDPARLAPWLEAGGVLVRFAGPRLAASDDETLVPVRLRQGGRALGGAMTWAVPARLAPFPDQGPFQGLGVPAEVTVARQVLAEPGPELAAHTWARLADGTPLVTAAKRGRGWLVLVHTSAGPDWSNLALSGLFVELLKRLAELGDGVAEPGASPILQPAETLDGFGRLGPPPAEAQPIAAGALARQGVEPHHPPGFYGPPEGRRALNLGSGITRLTPLPALPPGVEDRVYGSRGEFSLKPALLGLALLGLVFDLLLALAVRGLLPGLGRRRGSVAGLALLLLLSLGGPALAAGDDAFALKATGGTWLAYLVTGDAEADRTAQAGLEGLAEVINRRTGAEIAGALGVEAGRQPLAFFPLLFWALSPAQGPLGPAARDQLNGFLRTGGTLVLDTGTAGANGPGGVGEALVRRLTLGLELPPLVPLPGDHVLTKAFYLLQDFPGRLGSAPVWVASGAERRQDGVSPVVIGSADWLGAWAVDGSGRPLHPVVPGGEAQRELSYRVGVNLVIYALTGNYKADQVHVPAILERLGR